MDLVNFLGDFPEDFHLGDTVPLLAHHPSELPQCHPDLSHLAATIRPSRVVVARGGRAWVGPGNETLVEKLLRRIDLEKNGDKDPLLKIYWYYKKDSCSGYGKENNINESGCVNLRESSRTLYQPHGINWLTSLPTPYEEMFVNQLIYFELL